MRKNAAFDALRAGNVTVGDLTVLGNASGIGEFEFFSTTVTATCNGHDNTLNIRGIRSLSRGGSGVVVAYYDGTAQAGSPGGVNLVIQNAPYAATFSGANEAFGTCVKRDPTLTTVDLSAINSVNATDNVNIAFYTDLPTAFAYSIDGIICYKQAEIQ